MPRLLRVTSGISTNAFPPHEPMAQGIEAAVAAAATSDERWKLLSSSAPERRHKPIEPILNPLVQAREDAKAAIKKGQAIIDLWIHDREGDVGRLPTSWITRMADLWAAYLDACWNLAEEWGEKAEPGSTADAATFRVLQDWTRIWGLEVCPPANDAFDRLINQWSPRIDAAVRAHDLPRLKALCQSHLRGCVAILYGQEAL